MKSTQPLLNRDLHLRIDESLEKLISETAQQNCLKSSTLCRVILQRTLPQYSRNRFFA